MMRFAEPSYLWLLLLIPLVWWMARRLKMISPGRRYTIIAVRTLMLICVIFALARLEIRRESRDLSVFFLLDRSDSIPRELQDQQLELISELSEKSRRSDRTGVIVFGDSPSLETSPAENFDFEGRILSRISGGRTDIGSAVRLALAAFPADTMKRIVLATDGNENSGSALEIARFAANQGVPIDVIPMRYDAENDLRVAKLIVPQRTAKDAPFDIKVHLEAKQRTTGNLQVFRDGELIAENPVTVEPGRNPPIVLTDRLNDGGFHTYTARIETANDLRPQNNVANGFTYLKAEPKVLVIEGEPDLDRIGFFVQALRTENLDVEGGGPDALPISLDELQRYDSIILSNVSAGQMSQAQMQMLERGVHDLGIGLVAIGGPDAFGAGGYIDTPIEQALPVSMDIKQKKMLPNGALVIVLHTAEMPNANAWAREISIASLNALASQDYFGIVFFDWQNGDQWAWNPGIAQVGNKKSMRTRIKGLTPGDMPAFDPGMRMAADSLVALKAQTKHIVVISDGDASPPTKAVVQKIQNNGITISAVALAPHGGGTVKTMEQLAYWGTGNFYYPKTSSELPRIFTKEAVVVRKSLIREEQFYPRYDAYSEVLTGLSQFPPLEGYVITSIKDLATQALVTEWDDPLLAHWRYGLGKSVAFTSDAKNRWASNWIGWGSFAKFWAQTVRWSLRETNSPNYEVNTEISGGVGKVTIDAVDDAGNFKNFIDFDATVIAPDFDSKPLNIQQVAPGRYEATFDATDTGTYMLSMATGEAEEDEAAQFLTAGVSLSYSPEYETSTSAEETLQKIAETAGGRLIEDIEGYQPYSRDLLPARRPEPIWPLLLLIGAMLLPADVFLRRVYLNWADASAWLQQRLFPKREAREQYESRMDTLRAAKERATANKEAEQEEKEARAAFRERMEKKKSSADSEVFAKKDDQPMQRRRRKETFTADDGGQKGEGGISSLMEAKKRAQKRRKK